MAPDPTSTSTSSTPIEVFGNSILPSDPSLPKDASRNSYILIRSHDELTPDNLKTLRDNQADVFRRIGGKVFLFKYLPSDLKKLQSLAFVESAIVYDASLKVRSELKTGNADAAVNTSVVLFDLDLPTTNRVLAKIKADFKPDVIKGLNGVINFKTARKNFALIAKYDEVLTIEENLPISTHSNIAAEIIGVGKTNNAAFTVKYPRHADLTGANTIIGICDTGVDITHAAFAGNGTVARQVKQGDFNHEDTDGHGTHVAAVALGRTSSAGNTLGDITGIAPGARLYVQKLMAKSGQDTSIFEDKFDLFDWPATQDQVRVHIHSNSWGSSIGHQQPGYGENDAGALDRAAFKNNTVLYIFSAGNDGKLVAPAVQIGSYQSAKNVLTVGACYSRRPIKAKQFGTRNCEDRYDTTGVETLPDRIAPFSSNGPAPGAAMDDMFRIKPDVVAPGVTILAARSSTIEAETLTECLQDSGDMPNDANHHIFMSGTSMAAPSVAGMAALLREALLSNDNRNGEAGAIQPQNLTSALLKAIIINSADSLPGVPQTKQGYGRVNMEKALQIVREGWWFSSAYDAVNYNSVGVDMIFPPGTGTKVPANPQDSFPPPPSDRSLKVTMVYIDAAGGAIQDRLSLVVTAATGSMGEWTETEGTNVHQLVTEWAAVGQKFQIRTHREYGSVPKATPYAFAWYCN